MLLIDSLPDLSRELSALLIAAREPGLAAQIDHLEIAPSVAAATTFARASTPLQSRLEAMDLSIGTLNWPI